MRRLALTGGWLVVVVLTTALTWQIVSAADERVSERPSSPLNVAAPQLESDGESATTTLRTVTTVVTPTTISTPTATTVPGATTTTIRSTSTSTSAPSSTTASTVVVWTVKTTATDGGTVVVKYRPDEVVLQAASPAAGFRVEVDKAGPPEVDVEFESETLKVEYRATWDHGELIIEISESD